MKVFVVLSALAVAASAQDFKYRECGSKDYFELNSLNIKGKIALPSTVPADIDGIVKKDIPEGSRLFLEVYKIVDVFGERRIKIPCIQKAGSCDYDLCKFITKKQGSEPKFNLCSFWPEDKTCGCPVTKGLSLKKQNVALNFPSLPAIAKLLANGKYFVKAQIKDTQGKSLYCVEVDTRIG